MYYLIVLLWAIACLACYGLRRVQRKALTISCIAVPVGGLLISLALLATNTRPYAYIAMLLTAYVFLIVLSATLSQRPTQHNHR